MYIIIGVCSRGFASHLSSHLMKLSFNGLWISDSYPCSGSTRTGYDSHGELSYLGYLGGALTDEMGGGGRKKTKDNSGEGVTPMPKEQEKKGRDIRYWEKLGSVSPPHLLWINMLRQCGEAESCFVIRHYHIR